MEHYVRVFKALGEPTRIKILRLLSVRPMYVCELEAVLKMSQPRISQHLRVLKDAYILKENKEAQKTFYIINREVMENVLNGFQDFLAADITTLPEFSEESRRLAELDSESCVASCKYAENDLASQ